MNIFITVAMFWMASAHAETNFSKILAYKPINFSPHVLEDEYSVQIMRQCMVGLVTLSDEGKIIGGLAKEWSLSRDKRVYLFRLRAGLKYSDGSSFNVEDFITSLKNLQKSDSIFVKELGVLKGIRAVGADAVEISLHRPFPPLLAMLAAPEFGALKPSDIENLRVNKIAKFASLGAYYIEELKPEKIVLRRNPYYFNKANVHFETVSYDVGVNEEAAVAGFASGKYFDIYPFEVPEDLAKKMAALKIPTFSAMSWYLQFNLNRSPVNKLNFRKLIYKYFDFNAFLDVANKPRHFRAYGLIPRGFLGFKEFRAFSASFDDQKVLAEAGCSLKRPCRIELRHPYPALDSALKAGFAPLNSKFPELLVNVSVEERTKWYGRFVGGNYEITAVGNTGRFPDTSLFLMYLSSPTYHPGLNRQKIVTLLNKSLSNDDKAMRKVFFEKADDLLFDQMGIVPLYFGENPFRYVTNRLQPFTSPLLGFSKVRIEELRETSHQ